MKHVLPRLLRPVAPGVTRPSWVGGEEGVWSLVCSSCITAMISSGHELSRLRAANTRTLLHVHVHAQAMMENCIKVGHSEIVTQFVFILEETLLSMSSLWFSLKPSSSIVLSSSSRRSGCSSSTKLWMRRSSAFVWRIWHIRSITCIGELWGER